MTSNMSESALLMLASNTGNTESFVYLLEDNSTREIEICKNFRTPLKDYKKIAIGCYTWGNGKIPRRMKNYLMNNYKDLKDKDVFIFGSGNSIYPNFCNAVNSISKICEDSGALVHGTLKFEQQFNSEEYSEQELSNIEYMIKKWSDS